MGAWSVDAFGNDTACDWAGGFADAPGLDKVKQALEKVVATSGDYLDSDIACEALVACEIVARLHGKFGIRNAYSNGVDEWVKSSKQRPDAQLDDVAIAAIDRILGPKSELVDLWDDGERNAEWHGLMDDLRKRIRS